MSANKRCLVVLSVLESNRARAVSSWSWSTTGCALRRQAEAVRVSTGAHRYLLLGGAAFSQGATLGPLVGAVLAINPVLLLTAFAGTAAVFTCFSVSAMLSQRRSWLYLGGTLSSVCTSGMTCALCMLESPLLGGLV